MTSKPRKGKIHPKHLILESTRADCNQQENIVFLKTHKTASSTIQNIFFRYGLKNSLRFALPEKGWKSHLLGYPSPFQREFLQQERFQIIWDYLRVTTGSFEVIIDKIVEKLLKARKNAKYPDESCSFFFKHILDNTKCQIYFNSSRPYWSFCFNFWILSSYWRFQ